ncbi:MAG: DNA polymerase III subunit gamma/tau [Cyanobacteria bacterium J06573_11]
MYEPLHHKYRPQTFSQLVGQGAIAATLTHALEQNRIAPAYLFCGPRGTGKTSSARILAKSLNCLSVEAPTAEPCGKCDVCQAVSRGNALDIVEIDAASNTGVDNIRELIERAQFAPVQCRYKLFVLDEVHMLSTAAFNALLKTLEEPPDRVVFVLATTDPQRVLPTIISRCQRFDFRRIPLPSMVKHLGYIATEETIRIDEPAIQLVAQISQGGLRDAESLLDQLSLQADKITVDTVWDLVGAVPERDLLNLVRAIAANDSTALLERVRHLMDKGREPLIVLQSLVGFYRDLLIAKRAPTREDLVAITAPTWAEMTEFAKRLSAPQLLASQQKLQTSEVQVKNTTQPRLWLEITLTGLLPDALNAAAGLANATTARPAVAVPMTQTATLSAAPPITSTPSTPTPSASTPSTSAPTAPTAIAPTPIAPPPADSQIQPPPSAPASKPEPTTPTAPPVSAPAASPAVNPAESGPVTVQAQSAAPNSASDNGPDSAPLGTLPTEPSTAEPTTTTLPTEPTHEVAFGNLADLWGKLLAVLAPRGTQMLMQQQGVLLGFDGVGAKVGFRSASLQKMARDRIPNLEAAFETVFQRKIKVSLEVISAEESAQNPPNDEPPPAAPSAPRPKPSTPPGSGSFGQSPSQPANPSATTNQAAPSGQTGASANLPTPAPPGDPQNGNPQNGNPQNGNYQNGNGAVQPPGVEGIPLAPPPMQHTRNPRLEAPTGMVAIDHDQEKIKRFASFFNGQIVNLDDGEEINETNSKKQKSSDPGPDVPF